MRSTVDTTQENIKLLSTVDLDEVVETVAEIVLKITDCQAVSVLVWDQDLESFSDTETFGLRKKDFRKFAEDYAKKFEDSQTEVEELDLDAVDTKCPSDLQPVFKYRIAGEDHLCACLFIAGIDAGAPAEIAQERGRYPFLLAIAHAWEFRELKRENERLRARYEELEDSVHSMEEQTRKVIQDVHAKDVLRTRKSDYDLLLYRISNAVRSSLKIHDVLQKAVNEIGQSFHV